MHDNVGQKLERDLALQLFIARHPDNPHPASAQNLNERVAAEKSLSADKLTLRHVRRVAGSLVAHPARIMPEETAIKPKTGNASLTRHTASRQKFFRRHGFLSAANS